MRAIERTLDSKCGIYMIQCKITNDFYIGSSKNLRQRLWTHRSLLKHNRHYNQHLQNSWNKYGENNFDWSIIEYCNEDIRITREQFYVDSLHPQYNLSEIVELPSYSEESRLKHSITRKRMMSEGIISKTHTHEVWVYDLDTNLIGHYQSVTECAFNMNMERRSVSKAFNYSQWNGYRFFKEEQYNLQKYEKPVKDNSFLCKTIEVFNADEYYEFKGAKAVAKFFHCHPVSVTGAIHYKRHFLNKYTIRYKSAV